MATIATLIRLGVDYTITVPQNRAVTKAIAAIDEDTWVDIDYPDSGQAQVAEARYKDMRLVVRRTRLTATKQQRLWPDWRHHALITSLTVDAVAVDAFHRHHAVVELNIRDLKEGAGLEHVPSGHFFANSAWLACAVLAHNLIRWTTLIGDTETPTDRPRPLVVARTTRTRLLAVPGRLVNHAGQLTLRLPTHWPWADLFTRILDTLRATPAATG
jgi:hypothetical protein